MSLLLFVPFSCNLIHDSLTVSSSKASLMPMESVRGGLLSEIANHHDVAPAVAACLPLAAFVQTRWSSITFCGLTLPELFSHKERSVNLSNSLAHQALDKRKPVRRHRSCPIRAGPNPSSGVKRREKSSHRSVYDLPLPAYGPRSGSTARTRSHKSHPGVRTIN